jgi:hypothetical protein
MHPATRFVVPMLRVFYEQYCSHTAAHAIERFVPEFPGYGYRRVMAELHRYWASRLT